MKSIDGTSSPSPVKGRMGVRKIVALARHLRRHATDVERKLWYQIRDKQIEGFRFRRQRPIGKFIVDFICLEAKLIIELDGGQHATAVTEDEKRTAFLEASGYRVLRFWNNEVIENMEGVLAHLLEALLLTRVDPTPALPLAGEGVDRDSLQSSARTPSPVFRGKAGMGVPLETHGIEKSATETTKCSVDSPVRCWKKIRHRFCSM